MRSAGPDEDREGVREPSVVEGDCAVRRLLLRSVELLWRGGAFVGGALRADASSLLPAGSLRGLIVAHFTPGQLFLAHLEVCSPFCSLDQPWE